MRNDTEAVTDADSKRVRRRQAAVMLSRSLLVTLAIVVAYFVLPLTSRLALDTALELIFGLAALGALLAWQIVAILRSPYPGVQAVATLTMIVPLFLILFSTTYYVMSDADPSHFSEPLTRLDAVYFTVTTFATVGFGDIAASSQGARAAVTLQMVGGLVLVGLIARILVSVVEEAKNRRKTDRPAG
jgi:voltage-gated potassium channel